MQCAIARDPHESGAFVLTINGTAHRLTPSQFAALASQVIRLLQTADIRMEVAAARLVPCGKLPTREQFTDAFGAAYPHGAWSCRGHHALTDGDYSESDLWAALNEQYRVMLRELIVGRESSGARETVRLVLESLGLRWTDRV